MKTNNYTFKAWHNGVGEWFVFTVEAVTADEAYDEAYKVVHNTLGLDPEVDFVSASVTTYSIIVPTLDFVYHVCDTRVEAERLVQECIAWDKQHPQGFTPDYLIIENAARR